METNGASLPTCKEWSFKGRQTTDFFTSGPSKLIATNDGERVVPALLISAELALKLEEAIRSRRQHREISSKVKSQIHESEYGVLDVRASIEALKPQIKNLEDRLAHANVEDGNRIVEQLSELQKKKAYAQDKIKDLKYWIKKLKKKFDDSGDLTEMRWLELDEIIVDVWAKAGFLDPHNSTKKFRAPRIDPKVVEQARHHLSTLHNRVQEARKAFKDHAEKTKWGLTKDGVDLRAKMRKEEDEWKVQSERWLQLGVPEYDLVGVHAGTENIESCHIEHPVVPSHEREEPRGPSGGNGDLQASVVAGKFAPPPSIQYEGRYHTDDGIPLGEGVSQRARRAAAQQQDPRPKQSPKTVPRKYLYHHYRTGEVNERGDVCVQSSYESSLAVWEVKEQQGPRNSHGSALGPAPQVRSPVSFSRPEQNMDPIPQPRDPRSSHFRMGNLPEPKPTRNESDRAQLSRPVDHQSQEDRASNASSAKKRKLDTADEEGDTRALKKIRTPPPNHGVASKEPGEDLQDPPPAMKRRSPPSSTASRAGGNGHLRASSKAGLSNRGSYTPRSHRHDGDRQSRSSFGVENLMYSSRARDSEASRSRPRSAVEQARHEDRRPTQSEQEVHRETLTEELDDLL